MGVPLRATPTTFPCGQSINARICFAKSEKLHEIRRVFSKESTLKRRELHSPLFRVLSARYHLNSAVSRGTHSPDASGTSGSWAGALFPETRRRLPRVLGTGLHQPPALCALGTRVLLRVLVFLCNCNYCVTPFERKKSSRPNFDEGISHFPAGKIYHSLRERISRLAEPSISRFFARRNIFLLDLDHFLRLVCGDAQIRHILLHMGGKKQARSAL